MVRNLSTADSPRNNPLLSRTFAVAFIVVTVAIISFLCGTKKRRRSAPPPLPNRSTKVDENTEFLVSNRENDATYVRVEDKNDGFPSPESKVQKEKIELRPPPRLAQLRASSYHVGTSSNASRGAKLTSSMSMRVSGKLKGLKKGLKEDDDKNCDNDKLKREDSVWKKTIILGEKCRVPDEDEDDIIFDENGRRITLFHSISRQSSNISQEVTPNER
ncbi:hypothetical protein L6452_32359 [Arctium lappa]|uniref:Uncharacterized protein n=1 Tax=Arctium lappa TaxID=4217 RepID=A0ACB8Z3H3_ARCLA|nr:hypothetical protein L6452_32359 [Arctium lappa]